MPTFSTSATGAKSMFKDFGGVFTGRGSLPREDGTPEEVRFATVTPNFFDMLGGRVAFGRDFVNADGQPQPPPPPTGSAPVTPAPQRLPTMAILSYEYFQRRYGGDLSIIGRPIATAGGGGPVVVGVLAPGFTLLFPTSANVEELPDVWTAARLAYDNAQRNNVSLHVIGRLKDGVTVDRAQAAVETVAAELRRNFPVPSKTPRAK